MKKINLKPSPGDEKKLVLIGISSHENDYRLVWAINKALKFNFIRSENLSVHLLKYDHIAEFSRYVYNDEERFIKFFLISNRCPDNILFPEIKNIDFIIHVNGELFDNSLVDLLKSLRKVSVISGAYLLDPSKMKGLDRIIV